MEISQGALLYMLALSLLLGVSLGVVYDAVRFIRACLTLSEKNERALAMIDKCKLPLIDKEKLISSRSGRVGGILIHLIAFAIDLAFALFCGCTFILLQYYANDGEMRAFSLFGGIVGFLIYYCSIGKLTGAFLWRIAVILRILLAYAFLPFERALKFFQDRLEIVRARKAENRAEPRVEEGDATPAYQRLLAPPSKRLKK